MEDLSKAYKEICIILDLLGKDFSNKVPRAMRKFFLEHADKEYNPTITLEDAFNKKVLPETTSLIAMLYISYWTESKEEKYMSVIRKHDEERSKELMNNIFNNPKTGTSVANNSNNTEETIESSNENQIAKNTTGKVGIKDKISAIFEKIKNLIGKKK